MKKNNKENNKIKMLKKNQKMNILGIETSCDETSICLIRNKKIVQCLTWTQTEYFKKFGGVVPQIASQLHSFKLPILLKKIINESKIDWKEIDIIAYTKKPGLIGCLKIGETVAKTISKFHNIKIVEIDHLQAHIYMGNYQEEIQFPAIGLLLSGGHSQLIYMEKPLSFKIIGETFDDALGEALDKIGRLLNFSYPGGIEIEKKAKNGNKKYKFNLYQKKDFNFSFSGLKTNAKMIIKKHGLENINIKDFCFSLQEDVFDVICLKTLLAAKKYQIKSIVLGGGVSSNIRLREKINLLPYKIIIPPVEYCTDNGAMIALLAYYKSFQNKDKRTLK